MKEYIKLLFVFLLFFFVPICSSPSQDYLSSTYYQFKNYQRNNQLHQKEQRSRAVTFQDQDLRPLDYEKQRIRSLSELSIDNRKSFDRKINSYPRAKNHLPLQEADIYGKKKFVRLQVPRIIPSCLAFAADKSILKDSNHFYKDQYGVIHKRWYQSSRSQRKGILVPEFAISEKNFTDRSDVYEEASSLKIVEKTLKTLLLSCLDEDYFEKNLGSCLSNYRYISSPRFFEVRLKKVINTTSYELNIGNQAFCQSNNFIGVRSHSTLDVFKKFDDCQAITDNADVLMQFYESNKLMHTIHVKMQQEYPMFVESEKALNAIPNFIFLTKGTDGIERKTLWDFRLCDWKNSQGRCQYNLIDEPLKFIEKPCKCYCPLKGLPPHAKLLVTLKIMMNKDNPVVGYNVQVEK